VGLCNRSWNQRAARVGSVDGKLYALDAGGSNKWFFATTAPVVCSPSVGVSDQIYFGSRDGRLHAVMPGGSNAWAKATSGLDDSPALAAVDGTLYVSGSYKLYALSTSSGLAKSSWPMFRHDPRHTANASMPFVFPPTLLSPILQNDGQFTLDVYGEVGSAYEIDVSGDLNS